MNFKRELVTPDVASKYLEANTHNRKINKQHLESLCASARAGRWTENGDTISFGEDGVLQDGQHRLHMIVETGIAQWMLVVRDIPVSARDFKGTGKPMTPGQAVQLAGFKGANHLAAVARLAIGLDRGNPTITYAVTNDLILDRIRKDSALRASAAFACGGDGIIYRTSLGFCHYVWSKQDAAMADAFVDQLKNGEGIRKGCPAFAARRWFIANRKMGKRPERSQGLDILSRCWIAFIDGRPMDHVKFVSKNKDGSARQPRFALHGEAAS